MSSDADGPPFPAHLRSARDALHRLFTDTPFYATLGIDLAAWGPGWARVQLDPSPALGNLAGTLHGGVTFALADAAFEVACNSWGRMSVALQTSCHYHQPAPLTGTVTARAHEIARGGRTASYLIEVTDEAGTLLVSYQALAYRTSRWHVPPEEFDEGWG